jgi:hypothetical protein
VPSNRILEAIEANPETCLEHRSNRWKALPKGVQSWNFLFGPLVGWILNSTKLVLTQFLHIVGAKLVKLPTSQGFSRLEVFYIYKIVLVGELI